VVVTSTGFFFPGNNAPHAAIALCYSDICDTISDPPVAGRIEGERRRNTTQKNNSRKNTGVTKELSLALHHGLNLCLL